MAAAGPVLLRGAHAEAQKRPPMIIDCQVPRLCGEYPGAAVVQGAKLARSRHR